MKQSKLFLFVSILAIFIIASCKSTNDSPNTGTGPIGKVINYSECKNNIGFVAKVYSSSDECIEYKYIKDKKLLEFTHINTGMNCCPEKITADIKINGNNIVIREHEAKAGCKCECLFDVNYQFKDISLDTYTIEIYAPLTDGTIQAPFVCKIDLTLTDSSSYCMKRGFYPWGD